MRRHFIRLALAGLLGVTAAEAQAGPVIDPEFRVNDPFACQPYGPCSRQTALVLQELHARYMGEWADAARFAQEASHADPASRELSALAVIDTLVKGKDGDAINLARRDVGNGYDSPVSLLLLIGKAASAGNSAGIRDLLGKAANDTSAQGLFAADMERRIRDAMPAARIAGAETLTDIYIRASAQAFESWIGKYRSSSTSDGSWSDHAQFSQENLRLVEAVSLSLAAAVDPENMESRLRLVEMALEDNNTERAIGMLDRLPDAEKDKRQAAYLRASALFNAGNAAAADSFLKDAAARTNQPVLHAIRGGFLSQSAKFREAEQAYTRAIEGFRPGQKIEGLWNIYRMRGEARKNIGDRDGAEQDLRHAWGLARMIGPAEEADVLNGLGSLLAEEGGEKTKESVFLLARAVLLAGDNAPEYEDTLAWAWHLRAEPGDDAKAAGLLEKVVEWAPASVEANFHLGEVDRALGRAQEAGIQYHRTLSYIIGHAGLSPPAWKAIKDTCEERLLKGVTPSGPGSTLRP